jgi:RimJ/RimL family protein N-acetyltransferase
VADGARAIVRGERVWLRPFEPADLDAYHHFINDVDVAFWAGYGSPESRDSVESWYEKYVKDKHGSSFFVICPLGSDEFIGTVWIWESDSRLGGLELSIFVGEPDRWGSGIGTDAMNAALDAAFGFRRTDRVWLLTSADNARAQRAFEKVGFVREGMLRQQHRVRGKPGDTVLMAILRDEWEQLDRPRSWDYPKDGSIVAADSEHP